MIIKLSSHREEITLEEYKNRVHSFMHNFEQYLESDNKEVIYYVSNIFREDYQENEITYSSIFRDFNNVKLFIKEAESNLICFLDEVLEESEEYLNEFNWWHVRAFKLTKSYEYEWLFDYNFSGVNFNELEIENGLFKLSYPETELYKEWKKLSGFDVLKLRFPFRKGDILQIVNKPFSKEPTNLVYLGIDDYVLQHDFEDELECTHAFSYAGICFANRFLPCHMHKVEKCEDKKMLELSEFVKKANLKELEEFVLSLF